jgi:hypothetical protein
MTRSTNHSKHVSTMSAPLFFEMQNNERRKLRLERFNRSK